MVGRLTLNQEMVVRVHPGEPNTVDIAHLKLYYVQHNNNKKTEWTAQTRTVHSL